MKIKNIKDSENKASANNINSQKDFFVTNYVKVDCREFAQYSDKQFVIKEKLNANLAKKKFLSELKKQKFCDKSFLQSAQNVSMSLAYFPVFYIHVDNYTQRIYCKDDIKKQTGVNIKASYKEGSLSVESSPSYSTVGYKDSSFDRKFEVNKNIHANVFTMKDNPFFSTLQREGAELNTENSSIDIYVDKSGTDNYILKALSKYYMKNVVDATYEILQVVYFPVWVSEVEFNGKTYKSFVSDCKRNSILSLSFDNIKIEKAKNYYEKTENVFEKLSNIYFQFWSFVIVLIFAIAVNIKFMEDVGKDKILLMIIPGILFHWLMYYIVSRLVSRSYFDVSKTEKKDNYLIFLKNTKAKLIFALTLFCISFVLPAVYIPIFMLFS